MHLVLITELLFLTADFRSNRYVFIICHCTTACGKKCVRESTRESPVSTHPGAWNWNLD